MSGWAMFHKGAVLGHWNLDSRNVPDGACALRIPVGVRMGTDKAGIDVQRDAAPVPHGLGDRVSVTIAFDVTLEHPAAHYVNQLIQAAFDGLAVGAFEITREQLVLIDEPAT